MIFRGDQGCFLKAPLSYFILSRNRGASRMDELVRTEWKVREPSIIWPPAPAAVLLLSTHFVAVRSSTTTGAKNTRQDLDTIKMIPGMAVPGICICIAFVSHSGVILRRRCGRSFCMVCTTVPRINYAAAAWILPDPAMLRRSWAAPVRLPFVQCAVLVSKNFS